MERRDMFMMFILYRAGQHRGEVPAQGAIRCILSQLNVRDCLGNGLLQAVVTAGETPQQRDCFEWLLRRWGDRFGFFECSADNGEHVPRLIIG